MKVCERAGCGVLFTPQGRGQQHFCSDTCSQEAHRRVCQYPPCQKGFSVVRPSQKGRYCSKTCQYAALRSQLVANVTKATSKRVAKGRIYVACAWEHCPRPDELIPAIRSKGAIRHYHTPDCHKAWQHAGGGRKGVKRLGATAERSAVLLGARALVSRACPICDKPCPVTASLAARTAHSFCSRVHYLEWFRAHRLDRRQEVRCLTCGEARAYSSCRIPQAVDRVTMAWICPACQVRQTGMRTQVCTYAACGKTFTARVRLRPPSQEHFCCADHRARHYLAQRRARQCQRCGHLIPRRGRKVAYCSWACYIAAKKGRPLPHWRPSKAEQRILEQWTEGVRGVRALARESGASVNTVRKLIAAGKMVEKTVAS